METYHLLSNIVTILDKVKSRITDDSDMVWTRYATAKELRDELDSYKEQISAGHTACLEKVHLHFLPTSTLQEHCLSNGWADEYLYLAEQFDHNYALLKQQNQQIPEDGREKV